MSGPSSQSGASPRRSIFQLAWPLVLSFSMRSLFNFVDTGFAATLGDESVAAIGLTYPLEFLFIAVWVGTSTSLTSLLSRAMGAGEGERIAQVTGVARGIVAVLVPSFIAIGTAVFVLSPRLVDHGLSPGLVAEFRTYATVIVIGTALTGFWSIIPDSIIKAHHDTRATMWAGIASNLLNVSLNTLFLFGFGWGIFGIALSTVIGRFGGLAFALAVARRHERRRLARGRDTVPGTYRRPLAAMAGLAVPAAVTYGLVGIESFAVNALLAGREHATEAIAAFSIQSRFVLFFSMPVIATGVALLPFVGRAWGERDLDGIRSGFRQVVVAATAYALLVVTPLVAAFRRPLVALFAESRQTEELAAAALLFVPLACLSAIPFFACRPVFEGMQLGWPGLVAAVVRYVGLTIPCALLGAEVAGRLGQPELFGILAGLVAASAVASAGMLLGMLRLLARREAERPRVAGAAAQGSDA